MLAKVVKVAAVVLGGPVFAFALLSLGCGSTPPYFGEYCSSHLLLGPLGGFTLAFWFVVPMGAAVIRALRDTE
jgi:hypothetical protein